MRCPCCNKELEITHQDRYESIEEHVSDSNYIGLKDGYQCLNEDCIANNLLVSWTDDGEMFCDSSFTEIKYSVITDTIKRLSSSTMYYALDSWLHYYELKNLDKNKRKISFKIFSKYKIDIYPSYKRIELERVTSYKRRIFRKEIEMWKAVDEHSMTKIVPIHKMISFCIREFKTNYQQIIDNKEDAKPDYSLDTAYMKCFENIFSLGFGGNKDTRLFKQISSIIISIFYFKAKKKLLKRGFNYVCNQQGDISSYRRMTHFMNDSLKINIEKKTIEKIKHEKLI